MGKSDEGERGGRGKQGEGETRRIIGGSKARELVSTRRDEERVGGLIYSPTISEARGREGLAGRETREKGEEKERGREGERERGRDEENRE